MPTSTDVTNLKINQLTEAQYDTAVQGGVIGVNELSILTDATDKAVQVDTMPTASADELGNIYQFTGTTDANYTNGYFYKCVSDGAVTPTYSWSRVDVQPQAGGLPSQTGQSGKFLTTDGTDASWATVNALQNTATTTTSLVVQGNGSSAITEARDGYSIMLGNGITGATYYGGVANPTIAIGNNIRCGNYGTGVFILGKGGDVGGDVIISKDTASNKSGRSGGIIISGGSMDIGGANGYANNGGTNSIVIGGTLSNIRHTLNADYSIYLCSGYSPSSTVNITEHNTFWWGNNNGLYKLFDSDGTIPTDRFTTTPSADGTYVPTLTISSGTVTRSWAAPGGGGATSATATLTVNDWSNNSQTVNVTGVTASNNVIVAPAPSSQSDYTTAGILCTAQGAGTLTFTCTTTPSSAITVNVLII